MRVLSRKRKLSASILAFVVAAVMTSSMNISRYKS